MLEEYFFLVKFYGKGEGAILCGADKEADAAQHFTLQRNERRPVIETSHCMFARFLARPRAPGPDGSPRALRHVNLSVFTQSEDMPPDRTRFVQEAKEDGAVIGDIDIVMREKQKVKKNDGTKWMPFGMDLGSIVRERACLDEALRRSNGAATWSHTPAEDDEEGPFDEGDGHHVFDDVDSDCENEYEYLENVLPRKWSCLSKTMRTVMLPPLQKAPLMKGMKRTLTKSSQQAPRRSRHRPLPTRRLQAALC